MSDVVPNSEVARRLLKLFGPNGEHWTQGDYARDKNDLSVAYHAQNACKWCMHGGLYKLSDDDADVFVSTDKFSKAMREQTGQFYVQFNDENSWPVVKDALEKLAIT